MKRSYDETDRAIPAKLWEYFPQKKQQLLQIKSMENTLQTLLCQYKRKKLFSNCSERILNKILRIYIRHQYIPPGNSSSSSNTTSGEGGTPITVPITTKGYYLLTIEGKLLDLLTNDHYPFGLFFDQIRIHVDKKYLPSDGDITLYEWKKDQYQAGKKANCFQFKIYCDKSIPIKIYLTRSDYSCKRYELAISLRDLLPNMRIDPTEDEVMTAVWQYIELHSSYDFSTNRPLLRCDEVRIHNLLLSAHQSYQFRNFVQC